MTTVRYCDLCGRKANSHVCIMGFSADLIYRDFCLVCWRKVEKFLKKIKK